MTTSATTSENENIYFGDLWEREIFEGSNHPFAGRIGKIGRHYFALARAEE